MRYGRDLILKSPVNNTTAYRTFVLGSPDPALFRWLESYVKPGMTVLDVGANVGAFTLPFSQWVGPWGSVHAFEAVPMVFGYLKENVVRNGLKNVSLNSAAVGEEPGELGFCSLAKNLGGSHIALEGEPDSFRVPVVTLDQYRREKGLGEIGLAKIDVEGFEIRVLRGMRETLAASGKIAVVAEVLERHLSRFGGSVQEMRRLLEEEGFAGYRATDGGLEPVDWSATPQDVVWLRPGNVP